MAAKPKRITARVESRIQQLIQEHGYSESTLREFALFVLNPSGATASTASAKNGKASALTLPKLKQAIYEYFKVANTPELKKSGSFQMATDGMDKLDLSQKPTWEMLYRKFIDILPGEENQTGYGCINGIDIFAYFRPWQVFGLEAKTATPDNIKQAYRNLSKVYHPDVPNSGDDLIFERINQMYRSIAVEA